MIRCALPVERPALDVRCVIQCMQPFTATAADGPAGEETSAESPTHIIFKDLKLLADHNYESGGCAGDRWLQSRGQSWVAGR